MGGVTVAKPIVPVYADDIEGDTTDEDEADRKDSTERTSDEFVDKTDKLLEYINGQYMDGWLDDDGSAMMNKMMKQNNMDNPESEKKVAQYGFDALFMNEEKLEGDG